MIREISTSGYQTTYDIDGTEVKVWIIAGGDTLGLSIGIGFFSETYRFDVPENVQQMWSGDKFDSTTRSYHHQDPEKPRGPTLDLVPGGVEHVVKLVGEVKQSLETRKRRTDALNMFDGIKSRPVLSSNNKIVQFVIKQRSEKGLFPSLVIAGEYPWDKGVYEICLESSPSIEWRRLATILKDFSFDDKVEDLSETGFWDLIAALESAASVSD